MSIKNQNPYDRGRPNAPVVEPLAAVKASANTIAHAAGHQNMQHLIQLRWIAVIGQITTIAAASQLLDVRLPMPAMLNVLACLIAFANSHLVYAVTWFALALMVAGAAFWVMRDARKGAASSTH